jgi:hypothetical protein
MQTVLLTGTINSGTDFSVYTFKQPIKIYSIYVNRTRAVDIGFWDVANQNPVLNVGSGTIVQNSMIRIAVDTSIIFLKKRLITRNVQITTPATYPATFSVVLTYE